MADYKIKGLANPQYRIKGLASESQDMQEPAIQEPNEGISSIPSDIVNKILSLGIGAGNKAMQLPGEIGEAAAQMAQHPFTAPPRASRSILGGLMEGGKQLYNLPLNLNTYLASKNVPVFKQTAPLAEMLKIGDTGLQKAIMGEPQKGDQLWQDVGSILPLAVAPETMAAKIPGAHYLSRRIASKPYRQAANELKEAGVSKINPPKELIKDARQFFKDTAANRELIAKAETGDIPSLFKLQSDLGKIGAGYASNPFSFAERDFGKAALQTRDALLEHKGAQLKDLGLEDIAQLLEKGRSQYRGYSKAKPLRYTLAAGALSQTPIPSYLKRLMFH